MSKVDSVGRVMEFLLMVQIQVEVTAEIVILIIPILTLIAY